MQDKDLNSSNVPIVAYILVELSLESHFQPPNRGNFEGKFPEQLQSIQKSGIRVNG